jgi:hypothetical protein
MALLDAFAVLLADFRLDGEAEPFSQLEDSVWRALLDALGWPDHDVDLDKVPAYVAMEARKSGARRCPPFALGRAGARCDRDDEDGARHRRGEGTAGVQLCLASAIQLSKRIWPKPVGSSMLWSGHSTLGIACTADRASM